MIPGAASALLYWPGHRPSTEAVGLAPGMASEAPGTWLLYGDLSAAAALPLLRLDARTAVFHGDTKALAGLPDSLRARRPATYFPLVDVATRLMRVEQIRNALGAGEADGTGVLVAVVDTGIEVGNPDFRYPDGSTRFFRYWDQTVTGPRHDRTLTMGTECSSDDINQDRCNLDDEAPLNGVIAFGHGTHVAGIAASSDATYAGFAPGATLVGVRAWFDEASILLGLDYLKRLHLRTGRPMVVNLSLGTSDGGHDGNSVLEKWIEANSAPGFIFVAAAGNEAMATPATDGGIHTRLLAGNADGRAARWMISGGLLGSLQQAVTHWYGSGDLSDTVTVTRIHSGGGRLGNAVTLTREELDQGGSADLGDDIALLYGRVWFAVEDTTGYALALSSTNRSGSLSGTMVVIRFVGSNTPLDGWVADRSGVFSPAASASISLDLGAGEDAPTWYPGDNTATITVPASGRQVIAVGSFVGRTVWPSVDGNRYGDLRVQEGDMSPISSQGPSRDGRLKPEQIAPGQYVASTLSSNLGTDAVFDSQQPDAGHMISFGTSMASPMVAGVTALMLQRNPLLTVSQVRDLLALHSYQPFPFGDLPDNSHGNGAPDAQSLLQDGSWQQPEKDGLAPILSDVQLEEVDSGYRVRWRSNEMVRSEVVLRGSTSKTVVISSYDVSHDVVVGKPNFVVESILLFGTDWAANRSTAYNVPLTVGCGCRVVGTDVAMWGDLSLLLGLLLFAGGQQIIRKKIGTGA